MTPELSSRILVGPSMIYGVAVGAMAILGGGATGPFAVVGALVLSLLWVARSLFVKGPA